MNVINDELERALIMIREHIGYFDVLKANFERLAVNIQKTKNTYVSEHMNDKAPLLTASQMPGAMIPFNEKQVSAVTQACKDEQQKRNGIREKMAVALDKNEQAMDAYLDTTAVAKMLGLSNSYLEKTRWLGTGIPFVKVGKLVRYKHSAVMAYLEANRKRKTAGTYRSKKVNVLDTPLLDLDLSVRTRGCIESSHDSKKDSVSRNKDYSYTGPLATVRDLLHWSHGQLLCCPNFGRKSLNELIAAVKELGVNW